MLFRSYWDFPLGKRQIEDYLTQICPCFESFLESDGFRRSLLISQVKCHMKRKTYKIPYEVMNHPNSDGSSKKYFYHTRTYAPSQEDLASDESTSSYLDDGLQHFIELKKGTFKYLNVDDPPEGEKSDSFPATIISCKSEDQSESHPL